METAVTSNQTSPNNQENSLNSAMATKGAQDSNASTKEEPTAVTTPLFRPIKFESSSPTPATPEGTESNGSKSNLGTSSESGSDVALDSAYSSDNPNPKPENGKPAEPKITATLQNRSLWKDFKKIGNEMIVTKPGR